MCATCVLLLVVEASAHELPRDVDALIALVAQERAEREIERAQQQSALAQRDQVISQRDEKIVKLEHTVNLFSKWLWGPRSEKRPPQAGTPAAGQIYLPFVELLSAVQRVADQHGVSGSSEIEEPKPRAKNSGKRRSEFPEHLPLVRTTIEAPESERVCCEQPMAEMGAEVTRELERIEFSIVHEIARKKYCCRVCQEHVLTASGPTRAIDKGILGNGWLATLLVERFGNHMPYHRLEQKYKSEGIAISRSVLCRSAGELGERFEPVYAALAEEIVKGDVAFADETTVTVQEAKDGTSKKAQMWLYANKDGDCLFDYNESRGRDSPLKILKDFRGYLHDDGYCVYEVCLDPNCVKHVACWAHVRRKFVDAENTDPQFSKEAVAWIAKLYALDRQAKDQKLSPAEVKRQREQEAPAILAGFREWLDVRLTQVLPEGPMGGAIKHAIKRWDALCRFVEDGRLELDNNRAERALRQVAVGRKNWIFVGNERGGRTTSVFFSLVVTCKNRGIDPRTYLQDAMLRLKEGVDPKTLTPAEWQKRYAAEVADRRSYVLAQILGKLSA